MTLTAPAQASGVPELWFTSSFTAQYTIAAGDVNGDGADDLVGFNPAPVGYRVVLSNGSAFEPEQHWGDAYYLDSSRWVQHMVGDMDNDGRADAVVARLPAPRGIWVARSTVDQLGLGKFAAPPVRWLDNSIVGYHSNLIADLDADGDSDVIGLCYERSDPEPTDDLRGASTVSPSAAWPCLE